MADDRFEDGKAPPTGIYPTLAALLEAMFSYGRRRPEPAAKRVYEKGLAGYPLIEIENAYHHLIADPDALRQSDKLMPAVSDITRRIHAVRRARRGLGDSKPVRSVVDMTPRELEWRDCVRMLTRLLMYGHKSPLETLPGQEWLEQIARIVAQQFFKSRPAGFSGLSTGEHIELHQEQIERARRLFNEEAPNHIGD